MRLDRRIARPPELEEYLTAERQSLIDEDFCPGSTGIFGPPLELTRSDRNGDEPPPGEGIAERLVCRHKPSRDADLP